MVAKISKNGFLGLVNECIPSKEVTIHTDDKPWYDFAIKNHSRLRINFEGRLLKLIAKHTGKHKNLHVQCNKVNNLKKHAKEICTAIRKIT